MSDPDRLPDDLRELLDAERELPAPNAATRARMFERLAPLVIPAAIGAGAAADVGAAASSASSASSASAEAAAGATAEAAGGVAVALKTKAIIALIAASVGAVGGAATQAALGPRSVTPAPAPVVVVSQSTSPTLPPEVASQIAAPTNTAAQDVPSAVSAGVVDAPPSTAGGPSLGAEVPSNKRATPSSLRDERLLLERATAALVRGEATSALATLREHARRFPRGELAEEREVLLIRALRAAGDDTSANERAKRFKDEFPSSLQRGIIDAPASK